MSIGRRGGQSGSFLSLSPGAFLNSELSQLAMLAAVNCESFLPLLPKVNLAGCVKQAVLNHPFSLGTAFPDTVFSATRGDILPLTVPKEAVPIVIGALEADSLQICGQAAKKGILAFSFQYQRL